MANATASDVNLDDLLLNGAKQPPWFREAITSSTLTQTITGASTVALTLYDPTRAIIASDYCSDRTQISVDDLEFELVQVAKSGDQITLTFEDQIVATLRRQKKIVKAAKGSTSRVAFCRRLIQKVDPSVVILGPDQGPTILEEIAVGTTATDTSAPTVYAGAGAGGKGATGNEAVFLWAVGAHESGNEYGQVNSSSGASGRWQVLPSNIPVWTKEAIGHSLSQQQFLNDHAAQDAVAVKFLGGAYLAHGVQGACSIWYVGHIAPASYIPPGNTMSVGAYASAISALMKQAPQNVTISGLGASAGTTGTSSSVGSSASATTTGQGSKEDWWAGIQRIMQTINWRVFVSHGRIVIAPDHWLLNQPGITITEHGDGIDSIDFDVDRGKKTSTVTVTCRADRWAVLPGEPVTPDGLGPADDTFVTSSITRSLTSTTANVMLSKKQKTLPEPGSGSTAASGAIPNLTQVAKGTSDKICPFADSRLILPFNGQMPARENSATVVLHTNGGGTSNGSLYGWFSRPGNTIASHFQVKNDGTIEQYITLDRQAYAQYAGNAFAVSVETEDDGNPSRPWTQAQLNSIVRICKWVGCPSRPAPDGPGGGVGWHQEYTDWNTDGHDCPGPVRVSQIRRLVIPALGK